MTQFKKAILLTAAFATAGIAYAAPKADVDQNGEVTQSEFMAAATTSFLNMDTDADGVLTADEMKAGRAQQRSEGTNDSEKRQDRRGNKGDAADATDKDAKKAEREAKKAEREANNATRDANNATDAEGEKRKGTRGGKRGANNGASTDANGDGVITRAEFEARTLTLFERLDKNSDGVLTKGEGGNRNRNGKRGQR